jgi:cation diffusion facilitator CzcD-associated flavoprotein CzcO
MVSFEQHESITWQAARRALEVSSVGGQVVPHGQARSSEGNDVSNMRKPPVRGSELSPSREEHRARPDGGGRIAIIGAGLCGLALGVALTKAGIREFDIFEAQGGVGGTWLVNDYPGAGVDTPSALYQYSFVRRSWNRTHPLRDEMVDYFEMVARQFGLYERIQLDTKVDSVHWQEDLCEYELTTENGATHRYDIVVSCVGFLDDPSIPSWPGLEDFKGAAFHSTQWDHSVDLRGKRVAVVGVGPSSVQIAPAIQPIVDKLYVFQREPSWIVPKRERIFGEEETSKYANRVRQRLKRWKLIWDYEVMYVTGARYFEGNWRNRRSERATRELINAAFKDHPDLREAMTPAYPFSGKRRVVSDDFYTTLLKDNVELVPHAVVRVTDDSVVDATGAEYQVDVIVMATGFKAWNYLSKLKVYGRDGLDIQEVWTDGAYALMGMTLTDFPNFYMMYGPGTNAAGQYSVNFLAENQSKWIVKDIRKMRRWGYTTIETRSAVVRRYNKWLQKRLERTVWARSNNYFRHPVTGKVVTNFAGGITLNWVLMRVMRVLGTYGSRRTVRRAKTASVMSQVEAR